MKTAIQHLKISSARFHNFAFYLLTFYFLKLFNQFESIMQNKPNLLNAQMNVSSVLTKDYENKRLRRCVKTNPIQTQYKANTNPIPEMPKMNVNSFITKEYRKKDDFAAQKNKPNSNPIKAKKICVLCGQSSAKEKASSLSELAFINPGNHLLSPLRTTIGRAGLASEFGMGSGVSPPV
jgi:hypothetical protein